MIKISYIFIQKYLPEIDHLYLQLREYINEWRKQRGKEEEELKRLKDKQAKRKEIRYIESSQVSLCTLEEELFFNVVFVF